MHCSCVPYRINIRIGSTDAAELAELRHLLGMALPLSAIIINTSGGLAGGDQLSTQLTVAAAANFTVTSQAAERVYRTLGPAAEIAHEFVIEDAAILAWLPQETILFNASALNRSLTVRLGEGARFLAVEAYVLGRTAMPETLNTFSLRDTWDIYRGENLIHAERLAMAGPVPKSEATLHGAKAFATVMLVDDNAERFVPKLRAITGSDHGISIWNGKLLARLVAEDGFHLRKTVKAVLSVCLDGRALPRNWEM